MIVTLTVPDAVYQKYTAFNASNPRQALQKQVERFSDVASNERILILRGEGLKRLETLASTTIESPEQLAGLVERAMTASLGGVDIPLKDGQLKRFVAEAAFYKREVKDYLTQKLQRAIDEAFGAY